MISEHPLGVFDERGSMSKKKDKKKDKKKKGKKGKKK